MKKTFLRRLEELDLTKEEKKFVLKNSDLFTKIYFRGIRDFLWIIDKDKVVRKVVKERLRKM